MRNRQAHFSSEPNILEIRGHSNRSSSKHHHVSQQTFFNGQLPSPLRQFKCKPDRPTTALSHARSIGGLEALKTSSYNPDQQKNEYFKFLFNNIQESPAKTQILNQLNRQNQVQSTKTVLKTVGQIENARSADPKSRISNAKPKKLSEENYRNQFVVVKVIDRNGGTDRVVKIKTADQIQENNREIKNSTRAGLKMKSIRLNLQNKVIGEGATANFMNYGGGSIETAKNVFLQKRREASQGTLTNTSTSHRNSRPMSSFQRTAYPVYNQSLEPQETDISQPLASARLSTEPNSFQILLREFNLQKAEKEGIIFSRVEGIRPSKENINVEIETKAADLENNQGFGQKPTLLNMKISPFASPSSRCLQMRPVSAVVQNNIARQRGERVTEEDKIADIKRKLTLGDISPTKAKKQSLTKEALELLNHELSIHSDNNSNYDELSENVEDEEDFDDMSANGKSCIGRPVLLFSVYEERPKTIFFQYPDCCERTRDMSRAVFLKPEEERAYDLKFKSGSLFCVIRTFECAGFKRIEGNNWNAFWGKPKQDRVKEMNKYQKTNHFPGCWQLGRKDSLWRNLSRMKRQHPNDYTFIPNTFLMNCDFNRFSIIKENSENKALWIMKPCASACGRGIKLINKRSKLKKKTNYLVSEYISNPHLINGFKYDLRLYVLVSCFDPLRIYLHKEGLVRFATEKYSVNAKQLKERYVHLTNFSVNKNSQKFVKNEDAAIENMGSKWSLSALRKQYEEMGIDDTELWARVKDLVIKTIISAEPYMLHSLNRTPEHRNNCYEIYGFDVLIDSNLKPWLMEVNACPSLSSTSPLDQKIKTTLICDTMNLLGYLPFDKKKYEEDRRNKIPGSETRKYQPKNFNDILGLNEENCLELLSSDDWNVLFETDEEYYRRGLYERIFPLKENVDIYAKFFESQRYNNAIVWRWLKNEKNFLEKIYKKVSQQAV